MNHLVKDFNELQLHLTLNSNFRYEYIEGALSELQNGIITKTFGRTFITELAERHCAINPDPAITDEEAQLIGYLQSAITHLAFAKALPSLIVQMGNSGIFQTSGDNTKPIFQWQKLEYENARLETGYNSIEEAINYLIEERDHAKFAEWKTSDSEKKANKFFVSTAEQFNERYPIGSSRRTYEALKPFINEAEKFEIKPLIGASLFDDLKTKLETITLSEDQLKLVPYIQDAVANIAIVKSIGRLTVKIDAEGYRVVSISATGSDTSKHQNAATAEQLISLKKEAILAADGYKNALVSFLMANTDKYALFLESDTYSNLTNKPAFNSSDSKTFTF
ncbi:MAG: DUF6712 family protein [Bacteroidia bacterium]|jgi:hypothetical protein